MMIRHHFNMQWESLIQKTMGLNESKGNMYEWVTHTWNTVKGKCPHDCSYCYMKRWGQLKSVRFDEKELKTCLGQDNFIFVGSSCDLFAKDLPYDWIIRTMEHCSRFDNTYLFQSKNPKYFDATAIHGVEKVVLCTTIETNRVYPEIMGNTPDPVDRAIELGRIPIEEKYVTIEPIMDFDLSSLVSMIRFCKPLQVNIGADSGGNKLPEPSTKKIMELIEALSEFTTVKKKKNLKRLL